MGVKSINKTIIPKTLFAKNANMKKDNFELPEDFKAKIIILDCDTIKDPNDSESITNALKEGKARLIDTTMTGDRTMTIDLSEPTEEQKSENQKNWDNAINNSRGNTIFQDENGKWFELDNGINLFPRFPKASIEVEFEGKKYKIP